MVCSLDRAKLARLCEMFRSENEQERATAARLATNVVHAAGQTWTTLLVETNALDQRVGLRQPAYQNPRSRKPPPSPPRTTTRNGLDVKTVIGKICQLEDALLNWERQFVRTLASLNLEAGLTVYQWNCIEMIVSKLKRDSIWNRRAKKSSPQHPATKRPLDDSLE